jgi:hypothetical protein
LFAAFHSWTLADGNDVSKLPRKGSLIWFDDGSTDREHWRSADYVEQVKNMPRLYGRIIFPASAISILTQGTDAEFAWLLENCEKIGFDRAMLLSMGENRKKDGETWDEASARLKGNPVHEEFY